MNPHDNWQNATPVRTVDHYRDYMSATASISGNTDIATILGAAIPENAAGVRVFHGGTLYYNPNGVADATNAAIDTGYVIFGGPDMLANVRFSGSVDVSLVLFITREPGEIAEITT